MRINGQVLALALLLAPVGVAAQQGAAPASPAARASSPIERLLQRRTELALTADQVQKLEAIRQKSAARERELVAKVTEARRAAPGVPIRSAAATPAERRALHAKAQPFTNELRQLHAQQVQEARGVLTAEQSARAWNGAGQCCGRGPGAMRRAGGRGPGPMRGMGPRHGR